MRESSTEVWRPFNPTTTLSFVIGHQSFVTLKVYDNLGKEVAILINEEKSPGNYSAEFRVENAELASGVYFYRLQAGSYSQTKKMMLLK